MLNAQSPPVDAKPAPYLTRGSLRHDIEQLRYLRSKGSVGPEFDETIDRYERVLSRPGRLGPGPRARSARPNRR